MLKALAGVLILLSLSKAQASEPKLSKETKEHVQSLFSQHKKGDLCEPGLIDYKALSARLPDFNNNHDTEALTVYTTAGGGGEGSWSDRIHGVLLAHARVGERIAYMVNSHGIFIEVDKAEYDEDPSRPRRMEIVDDVRRIAVRILGDVSCESGSSEVRVDLKFTEGSSENPMDSLSFTLE